MITQGKISLNQDTYGKNIQRRPIAWTNLELKYCENATQLSFTKKQDYRAIFNLGDNLFYMDNLRASVTNFMSDQR